MSIEEKSIDFNFSARYFDNGLEIEKTKAIWFVFHGYGQLAFYFIRKFESLKNAGIRVIAPEGLSKFYLDEKTQRVGANWMTKDDRIRDIKNYQTYFKNVYQEVLSKYKEKNWPITLLGFSQGGATVGRCAALDGIQYNRLILWAGLFPFDMDSETGRATFKDKIIEFVYGTEDPYLNDSRFAEMEKLSKMFGVSPRVTTFKGGHIIDNKTLQKFISPTL